MPRKSRTENLSEIPLAPIDRILHKSGAERVRDEAVRRLRDILERIAEEISKRAVDAAKHARRKTIKREDIDFAIREFEHLFPKS